MLRIHFLTDKVTPGDHQVQGQQWSPSWVYSPEHSWGLLSLTVHHSPHFAAGEEEEAQSS